nr:TM2 domain-containing protein [uncultured Flavobacterium sp.]
MLEFFVITIIVGAGFFFQKKYTPTTVKYSGTAYVLWFFSIFGLLGFHRHYLGKYGTGCLWMFTCGCFGIGALVDLLTLRNQVNNHNNTLNKNSFPTNQNQTANKQIKFQATTYNQTTGQQIKVLTPSNAHKEEHPIKQNFADDTINKTKTDLHSIEVNAESKKNCISDKSYAIKSQPQERKIEQKKKVVISEELSSEIEVSKIYDTEASIVKEFYKEVGKIYYLV